VDELQVNKNHIRASTGSTPFLLIYSTEALILVEVGVSSLMV